MITLSEYLQKQKQKIFGYLLRISAVIVWGIQPLLFKYTPFSTIKNTEVKISVYLLGSFLSLLILLLIVFLWKKIQSKLNNTSQFLFPLEIPLNKYFFLILIGGIFWLTFAFFSLEKTSTTNFIVFTNFAPVYSLLLAFIFWRKEIPYLQNKNNAILISLIFLMGGIGSSFIFYKDFSQYGISSVWGDFFAILTMFAEIIVVVSQIRYSKLLQGYQSVLLSLYTEGVLFFLFAYFLFISYTTLSFEQIFWGGLAGLSTAIGLVLNYEAFKRMDGFIAFLMFNIAIVFTFFVETIILKTFSFSWLLLIGIIMIVASSILAEFLNTHCEKKQII